MQIFIIEHCEIELYEWSLIEYTHISSLVGKEHLWMTNTDSEKLAAIATVYHASVNTMHLEHACLLDPHATHMLTPEIARHYKYFIFGGILGDDPPSKKTQEFLTSKGKWSAYNLGAEQMPTDNAVYVVKKITEGIPLEKMQFISSFEIVTGDDESVTLPFKYLLIDGKPLIDPKIIEMLQREDVF